MLNDTDRITIMNTNKIKCQLEIFIYFLYNNKMATFITKKKVANIYCQFAVFNYFLYN